MDNFYIQVHPVVDQSVIALCKHEYPLHKKGCPNFGKKKGCPPGTRMLYQILDLSKEVYAIYNIFDYQGHADRMMEKHPGWSDRQARCVLYWQPKARKALKEKIALFQELTDEYAIIQSPEAHGVNVTETMKKAGIELEWPPKTVAYQIVLAGILKTRSIYS